MSKPVMAYTAENSISVYSGQSGTLLTDGQVLFGEGGQAPNARTITRALMAAKRQRRKGRVSPAKRFLLDALRKGGKAQVSTLIGKGTVLTGLADDLNQAIERLVKSREALASAQEKLDNETPDDYTMELLAEGVDRQAAKAEAAPDNKKLEEEHLFLHNDFVQKSEARQKALEALEAADAEAELARQAHEKALRKFASAKAASNLSSNRFLEQADFGKKLERDAAHSRIGQLEAGPQTQEVGKEIAALQKIVWSYDQEHTTGG